MTGTAEITETGEVGVAELVFDDARARLVLEFADERVQLLALGSEAHMQWLGESSLRRMPEMDGASVAAWHPSATFGDWSKAFARAEFLRTTECSEGVRSVVRGESPTGWSSTLLVDAETHRVVSRLDCHPLLLDLAQGVTSNYADFRDVGGMLLPFEIVTHYPMKTVHAIKIVFESAELGPIEDAVFELPGS